MESKGEAGGVRVFDSYAHHPQEISGDLQAARSIAGAGRLLVVFQPHLVSRTRIFGPAMGEALGAADEVVVLEVYLAREDADPDGDRARWWPTPYPSRRRRSQRAATLADAEAAVLARARPGDLVLTLGAGDVTRIGPRLLARLEERADA